MLNPLYQPDQAVQMILSGIEFITLLSGFLIAGVVADWRSGAMALLFLSLCIPAYALASRSRQPSCLPGRDA